MLLAMARVHHAHTPFECNDCQVHMQLCMQAAATAEVAQPPARPAQMAQLQRADSLDTSGALSLTHIRDSLIRQVLLHPLCAGCMVEGTAACLAQQVPQETPVKLKSMKQP